MKKLFLGLAFLGLMVFAMPNEAKAETPCETAVLTCGCDGTGHIVMLCRPEDFDSWVSILCCPLAD